MDDRRRRDRTSARALPRLCRRAAVLAALAVISACASANDIASTPGESTHGPTTNAPTTRPSPTQTPTTSPTTSPTQTAPTVTHRDGGTITVGFHGTDTLDRDSCYADCQQIMALTFTPLVHVDPSTGELDLVQAKSITPSDHNRVWTIKIRNGYTFSNH
ncbi:MAG: hypothetical protein ACRDP4_14855, partial [Nocardioidaceae bacterium]